MKKSILYITACLAICFLNINCSSGGGDDSPNPDPDPVVVDPPTASTLVFPEQNSECTEGTNITATESTIVFNWNDSNNTDSYQLFVKNLDDQTTQNYTSNVSERLVTLQRGTPYSWYVVSKNSGTETAQSTTWKFYNAGDATSSYAPFPADLVAPDLSETLSTSTTSVTLEWNGEDIDDDITEYDVLFGTETTPTNVVTTTSNTSFSVSVSSGNIYYWRIITYDSENNNSESPIFKFTIE